MIGLNRLKRAIEDVPTGGMQTGDPKIKMKLCDAQRLEAEFNAIISERDTLRQQNAELAAQVEVLKSHMGKFGECRTEYDASLWELTGIELSCAPPAQCLLEVKADAGRAGFIDGFEASGEGYNGEYGATSAEIAIEADKYANKMRGGE